MKSVSNGGSAGKLPGQAHPNCTPHNLSLRHKIKQSSIYNMSSPLHQFFQTTFTAAASIEDSLLTISIMEDNAAGHSDPSSIPQRASFRRQESYCRQHRRRKQMKKQRKQRHLEQLRALERRRWCSDETKILPSDQVAPQHQETTTPCHNCESFQSAPKIPRRRQSIQMPRKPCRRESGNFSDLSADALAMLTLSANAA